MTTKSDFVESSVAQFDAFEKSLNGSSRTSFHQRRKEALANFEALGMPTRKTENYKYTPITNRLNRTFDLVFEEKPGTIDAATLNDVKIDGLDAYEVVMINGQYDAALSNIENAPVEILDLATAYERHGTLIDEHFAQYANDKEDAFTALNTAFARDGVFIHLTANTHLEKPVVIYTINTESADQAAVQPRHLVLADKNTQATIIEDFIQLGNQPGFTNSVIELIVDRDAVINYYKLQLRCDQAYHVGNTHVFQKASSTVSCFTMTLSGQLVRNNLNIILDDEHCEANMNGLYLLKGDQHVDNQTMVDHRKPNSYSNELYKGIAGDQSTGVFNGKIYVRQDAQKTNAFQSNNNIVLTDEANINTKPQLEIWADDVKCSHGATTGQLDSEQVFYLRSRGIGEEEAKSMLLYAFAYEVIEDIKNEALKAYIDQYIKAQLAK